MSQYAAIIMTSLALTLACGSRTPSTSSTMEYAGNSHPAATPGADTPVPTPGADTPVPTPGAVPFGVWLSESEQTALVLDRNMSGRLCDVKRKNASFTWNVPGPDAVIGFYGYGQGDTLCLQDDGSPLRIISNGMHSRQIRYTKIDGIPAYCYGNDLH